MAPVVHPGGHSLYFCNRFDDTVAAAITILDTDTHATTHVRLRDGSTGLRGECVSPDGRYLYLMHTLARHHLLTTRVEGGWMNRHQQDVITCLREKNKVLQERLGTRFLRIRVSLIQRSD